MTYDEAKVIAEQHLPGVFIDPFNKAIPATLVVRRKESSNPFNISLPATPPNDAMTADEIAESERKIFIASLDTARSHIGM